MRKYLNVIKKCSLFKEIEDDHLLRMLNCLGAKIKTYNKKDIILAEKDKVDEVGIVLSGSIQIIQIDIYGNRNIISECKRGDLFAEDFACANVGELPVSIIANEECSIMFIKSNHILHTCKNACGFHHQLIYNLMQELAHKTIQFHNKIEIVSKRTTRDKLLTYLLLESKKNHSNQFEIPFNRQELADYLQVDRSGLSVEISKLIKEGIINSNKKHFIIYKIGESYEL